jgi:hypothetical protein
MRAVAIAAIEDSKFAIVGVLIVRHVVSAATEYFLLERNATKLVDSIEIDMSVRFK